METISLDIRSGSAPMSLDLRSGSAPLSLGMERIRATSNYEELANKPSINEVELVGNKTFEELGDTPLRNSEISSIFHRVFN